MEPSVWRKSQHSTMLADRFRTRPVPIPPWICRNARGVQGPGARGGPIPAGTAHCPPDQPNLPRKGWDVRRASGASTGWKDDEACVAALTDASPGSAATGSASGLLPAPSGRTAPARADWDRQEPVEGEAEPPVGHPPSAGPGPAPPGRRSVANSGW